VAFARSNVFASCLVAAENSWTISPRRIIRKSGKAVLPQQFHVRVTTPASASAPQAFARLVALPR